jgi:hypothetical protein
MKFEVELINAGFGYNHRCEVLLDEARRILPGADLIQILSIGDTVLSTRTEYQF